MFSDIFYELMECEIVEVNEQEFERILNNDVEFLTEAAKRAYKKDGTEIKRVFKCTSGPKKGRMVCNPLVCSIRKDPKRSKKAKISSRKNKSVRIRKSLMSKKQSISKLIRRLNAR